MAPSEQPIEVQVQAAFQHVSFRLRADLHRSLALALGDGGVAVAGGGAAVRRAPDSAPAPASQSFGSGLPSFLLK